MKDTDILTGEQLSIVKKIADKYNIDYRLILAIGQHETQWGKLGDGLKGMYTGYGSFDAGSDYGYAGFEKQVAGTASKMAAWGFNKNNVTLDRLQLGNSGALPTGIYATDQNWSNAVYRIYKSITGDTDSPGQTQAKEQLSKWDQIKQKLADGFNYGNSIKWLDPYYIKTGIAGTAPAVDKDGLTGKTVSGDDVPEELDWIGKATLAVFILLVIVIGFISFFKAFDIQQPALTK